MIYIYDGSFEGFLSAVFDSYTVVERILGIEKKNGQESFFDDRIEVQTDLEKANRVKKSIIEKLGYRFFYSFKSVFLSNYPKKEIIAARTLKEVYKNGLKFLNSVDYYALNFTNISKNVGREVHAYLGLLRFEEVEDNLLFSKFTPKNDILELVFVHFKKRMSSEHFIIADISRNKAIEYNREKTYKYYFEMNKNLEYKFDEEAKTNWKTFYNAIGIKQRYNPKLRMNNMPKKYWKNLPELE